MPNQYTGFYISKTNGAIEEKKKSFEIDIQNFLGQEQNSLWQHRKEIKTDDFKNQSVMCHT